MTPFLLFQGESRPISYRYNGVTHLSALRGARLKQRHLLGGWAVPQNHHDIVPHDFTFSDAKFGSIGFDAPKLYKPAVIQQPLKRQ